MENYTRSQLTYLRQVLGVADFIRPELTTAQQPSTFAEPEQPGEEDIEVGLLSKSPTLHLSGRPEAPVVVFHAGELPEQSRSLFNKMLAAMKIDEAFLIEAACQPSVTELKQQLHRSQAKFGLVFGQKAFEWLFDNDDYGIGLWQEHEGIQWMVTMDLELLWRDENQNAVQSRKRAVWSHLKSVVSEMHGA